MRDNEICVWTEDLDGNWSTECYEMFVFNEGGPIDNGMRFCCYCGRCLEEVKYKEE